MVYDAVYVGVPQCHLIIPGSVVVLRENDLNRDMFTNLNQVTIVTSWQNYLPEVVC